MTLAVRWRLEAENDLLRITSYIADRNFAAAERIGNAIRHTADRLPDHPRMYRPGRVPGTREAIVNPSYILVYRIGDTIEILSVLHARQQYP